MKVALIHPQYRPDGGAEKAISCTIEALLHKGASVKIITRKWAEQGGDVEVVRCDPFYLGRLWREWSFVRAAGKVVAEMDVDIVQSQVRLPGCDIYRAGGGVHREWLKQRNRIVGSLRRLSTRVGLFHRYKLAAESELYADPRLRAVICNSKMVKKEIEQYFDVPPEKIHVVYNSVDLQGFDPRRLREHRGAVRNRLGVNEGTTVFLFVGSGFERKGLDALLEAMAALPKDCFLIVVGKDRQAGAYQRKSRALGIAERVWFAGVQKDVRPFYAAADAFVLPTLYDAFANTVLEAMAAALPVITSCKCGAVDIIDNGSNGFVCDALDVQKISEYMESLRDPGSRRTIGDAGRDTVAGFTVENMSRSLYALYEKVLS